MTEAEAPLLAGYDFVDFGCSAGGSMAFARDHLGARRGLGLDIDRRKVEATREAGFEAEVTDVTTLDPAQAGTTRFAILAHFLEHLPELALAEACIDAAVRVADEFVFIRQPWFDADEALREMGLKLYWSDWHGHPNHMRLAELRAPLDRMLRQGRIGGYVLFGRTPVTDSDDRTIHPLSAPRNQHHWELELHGAKPSVAFGFPVYRELGALVRTRADAVRAGAHRFLAGCVPLDGGGTLGQPAGA